MFKNILVPTDVAPLSLRAVGRAVQFAAEQKARVTGFYVGPAWTPKVHGDSILTTYVSPEKHSELVRKTADRYLDALRKEAAAASVPCKCLHAEGNYPYERIIK